jgi:ferredoxin
MDGDGPTAGDPFPIGAILAGTDPLAVDVAGVALIDREPLNVPTISAAVSRGWTTGRLRDLDLVGDDLADLRVTDFRLPLGGRRTRRWMPDFVRRLGTRHLVARPVISDRCINCGRCVENCPVGTITKLNGYARIELSECIRCYCCHELCPIQAIDLYQPGLGRLVNRFWS